MPQYNGVAEEDAEVASDSDCLFSLEIEEEGAPIEGISASMEVISASMEVISAGKLAPPLATTPVCDSEPAAGLSSTANVCSDHLHEVPSDPSFWPSQRVLSLQEQVHEALRAKLPTTATIPFPALLAEVCEHFHISLVDMQVLLMPQWGLERATPFRSKDALFQFLNRKPEAGRLGEVSGLNMRGLDLDPLFDMSDCVIRTVRWVELLDGTVLARLLLHNHPTVTKQNWLNIPTRSTALRSLSKLPWSPRLHWAFPKEYRKRIHFLLCLGYRLNLGSPWREVVLPFFASLAPDELVAVSCFERASEQPR